MSQQFINKSTFHNAQAADLYAGHATHEQAVFADSSFFSSWAFRISLLLIVLYFFFFFRLGVLPLIDPDEARYAQASRTMVESGDWVVPQWNGEIRLQKPILFYWLQALSYYVCGDEEYAARLPSALAAAAVALMLYGYGSSRWGEMRGRVAALGFSAFPLTIACARAAITDMTLTAFVTSSVLSFLYAYRERSPRFVVLAYLFLGFALLTKGPVALLFVLPAFVSLLFSSEIRTRLPVWAHFAGIVVMVLVLLPWLVLVTKRIPTIWSTWFFDETIARVLTDEKHRHVAWWFYIPVTLLASFPVSLLFVSPSNIKRGFQHWKRRLIHPEDRALLFWAFIPIIFFSLSRSQMWTYVLPSLPAIALLFAPVFYFGKR